MAPAVAKRTRGPNRQQPWRRRPEDGMSVVRLALDVHDPVHRHQLEAMFQSAFQIRRAVQRTARSRIEAYWAATHPPDAAGVRERLGLSRAGLERAAYKHLDGAPHLRRHVTKALAMHLADGVWTASERHLFPDATGKRHGMLHIGRWHAFHRLPGRARSHTKPHKWETFRLHGSLAGHRSAYTGPDGRFIQPHRLRVPPEVKGARPDWWAYEGPLVLVFSGLANGTLVLPVRLPTSPSNQPVIDHHLADPSLWHKVDVVRTPDPHTPGGWRYEAHLMVLTRSYVSPSTEERRANVALDEADRVGGIDVNVSNLTIASQVDGGGLRLSRVEPASPTRQRDRQSRRRRRERRLDRSRRAMNPEQYRLSERQERLAQRRAATGRKPVQVIPQGPRVARADGRPQRAYRHDQLSEGYRRNRAAQAAEAAARTQARRDTARQVAAEIVATHGYQLVVEDNAISGWARNWGRGVAAFTPGTLVAAIEREARAVAEIAGSRQGLVRVPTRTTALSQHCPCGARVDKTLAERVHRCPHCGLRGDRDAVSAVLGAFIVLKRPDDPSSASVDYEALGRAGGDIKNLLQDPSFFGWQDTQSESTDLSASGGPCLAKRKSTSAEAPMARRTVGTAAGPTRNETGFGQTTFERARWRTDLSHPLPSGDLWDSS